MSLKSDEYRRLGEALTVPSLPLLLLQVSSILAAEAFVFDDGEALMLAAAVFAGGLVGATFIFRNMFRTNRWDEKVGAPPPVLTMALFTLIAAACMSAPLTRTASMARPLLQEQGTLDCRVETKKERRYHDELTVAIEQGGIEYRGSVSCPGRCNADAGDAIAVRGRARALTAGQHTTSYEKDLIRRGMSFTLWSDREAMDVTARADQWPRRALREAIIGRCEVLFSPETSAFARALILGNQNCLSKKTISSFREAGAVHVLAASGLHVAILAAIPLALMGAIRTRRKIILCVTMAVLLAYLYVTDMPVSLMRACVMFGIVTIQHLWSLRGNSLNSLFLAAVALLCHSPADLFTLGFQLSFGATLGILCFHGLYSAALSGVRLYGPVRSSMAVTLAAQMVVTPIVLARLGETTYLSILSNLIIIPVTAATFIAALAALALHPLSPPLAFCAGHAVDQAFTLLQNAAGLFSSLQGRVCVDGIDPTVALALALLAAPLAPRMRKKTALLCLIIAHALLFTLPLRQHTCPWESIIFEDSTGRTVLVRRGSHVALAGTIASRSAAQAISAEIEEKPYSSLELAIPQADPCTMRHFTRIIKSCRVDRCHIEPHFLFNDDFRELCRIAQADSVTLEVMKTIGNTDATDSKKNEALHQALHLYYLRPGKPSRRFRKEGQYKNKLHAIHGR